MTKVSHFMLNELPPQEDLVIGGIYHLTTGTTYIVRNDGLPLEFTNIVKVNTLPAIGDRTKLYLWINEGKFKLYTFDGSTYIPMDIPDISQLLLDLEDLGYDVENIKTNIVLFGERIESVRDDIDGHVNKIASTTELGHVKIDGTSVKMHENNQLYVDIGDLPIPIQINNEYVISDSPTTYPVGHTITMLGSDDPGFADLISEFNLDYDIELTSLNTRFIVQTVKNKNSMTHQTAQAITNNRGSLLGTMYRFSQSSYYGFSSWYSQTHVLTGRGAPGDQGRGEGIAGNLYVNSITGRVHAKAGYDKTVGYTNWRLVGPAVVNNTFEPEEDDDEHVYSAYTVERMFEGAKNNLKNNVKLNRIWESDPIPANAPSWTVDFSDEPDLTDLTNYDFEIYDDGVLIFGNPITHVVNNETKMVTFTPQRPMPRAFTLTCIGRGMEFY